MRSMVRGIVTGALVGATAMFVASRMDRSTQKKVNRYVVRSAQRTADWANQLFR